MALYDDFYRFEQWLAEQGPAEAVLKISSVVEASLSQIARTTHAGGQRTRLITPLIRAGMLRPLPERTQTAPAAQSELGWTRLSRLEIGPFRGFRRQEVFDLDHQAVLVLGANGTGKSSLCEALELALLGRIEEADERAVDARRYFDNAHEGSHQLPVLVAKHGVEEHRVTPNEERHRFIIIERNRIESFARIGARRPAEAASMLAALFGLTAFNDFVAGFGGSLDRQLNLALPKAADLAQRRVAIQADEAKIASEATTHATLDAQRAQVAADFELGLDYLGLKARIGTTEVPGRLQEIRATLATPLIAETGICPEHLIALRREHRDLTQELFATQGALVARAQEVSYRELYHSIVSLQKESADRCPACETPLDQTTTNPFGRATAGLVALSELSRLEAEADRLERLVMRSQGALDIALRKAIEHIAKLPNVGNLSPIEQLLANADRQGWRQLLAAARELKRIDASLTEKRIERQSLEAEAEKLQAARTQLASIAGQQRQFDAEVASARERVAAFANNTGPLMLEVVDEAAAHDVEMQIKEAYDTFLTLLRAYLAALPEHLMADINEITVDLYNSFNAHDHADDLIHTLRLPLRGGAPLEIAFARDPDRFHNALAILSEGHLRCLGLSILLAKNIKLNLPTVLLDDAVNAIDHEHREGIRVTLFGHPALKKKQLIVTCHSPEFIKDIFNNHTKGAPLYVLRHHRGDHHPIVSGGKTRSYIERAESHIADFDSRAALSCCRQALESLVTRTWKKLADTAPGLAELSLRTRRPGAPADLSNIVQVLLSAINKGVSAGVLDGAWIARQDHLDAIVNVRANSLAWMSLNKGTHEEEDREDFEEPTLRRIAEALRGLDASFGN
ncbi:AAA family ATPase [uncultured Stenotrophomonas sp.]|uniref:AAA family ATPase n=1 Tax=uncultured Stenotrophomonas sp. TaxID=165438 RepID=UPI0028E1C649|nr:AAA family ATPase [uncultured Stenotrophomonas sp.]